MSFQVKKPNAFYDSHERLSLQLEQASAAAADTSAVSGPCCHVFPPAMGRRS